MKNFGQIEKELIELFRKSDSFVINNNKYQIINVGKPLSKTGECKTDVYVLAHQSEKNIKKEFKISIKKSNADFLENKISKERAYELFGSDYKKTITKSISSIKNSFMNDFFINFKKHNRTEKSCLKIGWKFELLNKKSGEKSGEIKLTDHQKIEIFSGSNLNDEKKDSKVNGEIIKNSGVASHILIVDDVDKKTQFYFDNLEPIESYALKSKIFFACKAINYRSSKDKWDGNRPLAVYLDWKFQNHILTCDLIMNNPFELKANMIGENIRKILFDLGISYDNFNDLKKHLNKSIKYC